jgi:outer membrane receptor protein involved in Fe transport
LGLTHAFPGEGRTLSVKVTLSQNREIEETGAAYAYTAPAPSDLYQNLVQTMSAPELDLKVDYKTPLPNKAKLSLGYEGVFDWPRLDDQGLDGPSAPLAVVDPTFAQTFTMGRRIQAIYGAYEQTLGRLTIQPGLRLESTSLETDLVSAAERGGQDDVEVYPSLHLDYALTDAAEIKASYGRRTQRPDEAQLDPFLVEASATSFAAGNPDLRPAFTQSYELGFEYRKRAADVQATLFYRDKTDLLTTVTKDLGDEVLLSTWENLGHAHEVGLELVGAYTLWRTLSLNASTDLMRAEAAAANLGVTGVRSAFIASGKITLNWQASPKDDLQLAGDASGRQLTAQGYRGGAVFSDFGWRHQFDARLSLLLTAEDPFGLSRRALVVDTATLIDVEKRKFNPTAVFLGFTYAFGAQASRAGTFAFDTPGHGAQ